MSDKPTPEICQLCGGFRFATAGIDMVRCQGCDTIFKKRVVWVVEKKLDKKDE